MTSWLPRIAAILSGFILTFAYPRWDFESAVWFWLLPLLWALWPPKPSSFNPASRNRSSFFLGYLAGLAFFIPNLFWIRHSSRVIAGAVDDRWIGWGPELMGFGAVIGLSGYCALYFALWAWFVARYARPQLEVLTKGTWQSSTLESLRSSFLAAAAWVACEWLRSTTVFTGFGWNGLGVGLHQNQVLIQIADVVGVMGLSFLPVFVVCTGWHTLTRLVMLYRGTGTCRTRLDFTFAMIVLLGVVGYGYSRMITVNAAMRNKEVPPITVRTLLVQPNIPQVVRWTGEGAPQIYQRMADLTRLYAEARDGQTYVDLAIWPESALPINLYDVYDQLPPGEHVKYFNDLLSLGDFSLLSGVDVLVQRDEPHTSMALFRGGVDAQFSTTQFHHKYHLVPFGEYLPFREIPPFSFLKGVLPGDFRPGTKTEPLLLAKPKVQIIPLICFEDTVGRVARLFVRPEPQMIVNVTNDGWFLQSEQTAVHLANAKFRAIELRRPMVRATNTGISCFIDTLGKVTSTFADPETGNTFLEGCLPGEVLVPIQGEMTIYARHGDWFALLMLGGCAVVVASGILRVMRLTARNSGTPAPPSAPTPLSE